MVRRGWVLWISMSRQKLFDRIRRDSWHPQVFRLSVLAPVGTLGRDPAVGGMRQTFRWHDVRGTEGSGGGSCG